MALSFVQNEKVLNMFFIVDVSGSMGSDSKIGTVNRAINNVIAEINGKLQSKLDATVVKLRVVTFCSKENEKVVKYVVGDERSGVDISSFVWKDISKEECYGGTPIGSAIDEVSKLFEENAYREYLGKRIAPPFLLLVSDGVPTEDMSMVEAAIDRMHTTTAGLQSVFTAIGIDCDDSDVAAGVLKRFGKNGYGSGNSADPEVLKDLIVNLTISSIKANKDDNRGDLL